jgi:hypothetical protein
LESKTGRSWLSVLAIDDGAEANMQSTPCAILNHIKTIGIVEIRKGMLCLIYRPSRNDFTKLAPRPLAIRVTGLDEAWQSHEGPAARETLTWP